jgi:hypothetical protein
MLIPLQILPKLRIDWKKKLTLMILFTLGIFAICAAIVRLVMILRDASLIHILIGSGIEQDVCYLCANAPALRPLFFRDTFTSQTSNGHSAPSHHDTYEMVSNVTGAKESQGNLDSISVGRTVEVTISQDEDIRTGK